MKQLFLLFFFCVTTCLSASNVFVAAEKEMCNGNFTFASQLINVELQNNSQLTDNEREKLNDLLDIMHRIRIDFNKKEADILPAIKKYIPDVSPEMLAIWEASKALEVKMIDGEKWYFRNAARNLFRIDSEARQVQIAHDGEKTSEIDLFLQNYLPEMVENVAASDDFFGKPQNITVTYTLKVKPNQVPEGKIIRCWLPFPRSDVRRQTNVKLIASEPENGLLAPDSCAHKTVYFERKAEKDQPTVFKIKFSYTARPEFHDLNAEKVSNLADKTPFLPYLAEQKPNIVFTDTLKKLARQIVGNEKNPYLQAKMLFTWICDNYPWASAREYSTIPNIPQYVIENGHGDCGQVSLLFITFCRYLGIPARWQSGFMLHPKSENLHDWAEIYLQNVGWVPVDTSFGVNEWAKTDALKYFFLGGTDAFHMIVNSDCGRPLFPDKKFLRSETVDFQRGEVEWEGGNLYFDQWNYSFEVEIN